MDIEKVKEQIDRAVTDIEEIQSGALTPEEISDNLRCAIYHLRAAMAAIANN